MFKHMHAYAHSVCNRGGAIAQIREVLLSESIMIDPGIENPLEDFMAALVTTITLSVFHDAAILTPLICQADASFDPLGFSQMRHSRAVAHHAEQLMTNTAATHRSIDASFACKGDAINFALVPTPFILAELLLHLEQPSFKFPCR